MDSQQILISAFHNKPLFTINNYKFILNPLTEQVPATSSKLLRAAAESLIHKMKINNYNKLITEEDKGAILVAAVSLLSGLPFGMARWMPNKLADQINSIFSCEYTQGTLYLCGIERGDQVCIIDDLISTGGTLIGMIKAIQKIGADIRDIIVIGEKIEYKGVERVHTETGIHVQSILEISVENNYSEVITSNF